MGSFSQSFKEHEHEIIKEIMMNMEIFKKLKFIGDEERILLEFARNINNFVLDYLDERYEFPEKIYKDTYYLYISSTLVLEAKNLNLVENEPENIIVVLKSLRKAYKTVLIEVEQFKQIEIYVEEFIDYIELYIIRYWKNIKLEGTHKNETKFFKLNETLPVGIQVLMDGKSIYVNSYLKTLIGYTCEEYSKMTFADFIHPDFLEITMRKVYEHNCKKKSTTHFQTKVICKGGDEKWVDIKIDNTAVSGEVYTVICVNDITSHKTLEEMLKQREEQLMLLFDSIPGAIIFKGGDGRWLLLNKFAVDLLRIQGVDYKWKSTDEIISISSEFNRLFSDSKQTDEKAWRYKRALNLNKTIELSDSQKMDLEISKIPVFNENGTRKGMLSLAFDATERKLVEEMSKKVEESARQLEEAIGYERIKTEFFANISHELRTPVNVIFSALQLFETLIPNDGAEHEGNGVKKYLKIMKQNCYRLVRLINNLIDISKIDAGYYEIFKKNCDIISIVEDITMSVVDYAGEKGIDIIFDTDAEEKMIACDPDKIERIMLNILSNAVKFTPSGGNIKVDMHDEGENIVISVKDSGIGIPIEKQHAIFDRFIQVDKSLSRRYEGSGIGLSIVKSLVKMHEGTIKLKSQSGEGSEFIISFPAVLISCDDKTECEVYTAKNKVDITSIEFSDVYS